MDATESSPQHQHRRASLSTFLYWLFGVVGLLHSWIGAAFLLQGDEFFLFTLLWISLVCFTPGMLLVGLASELIRRDLKRSGRASFLTLWKYGVSGLLAAVLLGEVIPRFEGGIQLFLVFGGVVVVLVVILGVVLYVSGARERPD